MKTTIRLVLALVCGGIYYSSWGQAFPNDLYANSVWCRAMDDGGLFFDDENIRHGYGILDTNGLSQPLIFNSALWFGVITDEGEERVAIGGGYQTEKDVFKGPVSNNNSYNSVEYQSDYSPAIWKVTRAEIIYHIEHYTESDYIVPSSILNWPANGNSALGIADNQAPYIDVNEDGYYTPAEGDYPRIKGDAVAYMILNDVAESHTFTPGNPIGIEVHLMLYQYRSSDYIDSSTFLNVRVINRSVTDYVDSRMAFALDADIGCPENDYCGSDSLGDMLYFYNGMVNDESCNGSYGFGENPPAFGVKSLNYSCNVSVVYVRVGVGGQDTISYVPNYWEYMGGIWQNGYPFHYSGVNGGNGLTSTHTFTGNPVTGEGLSEVSIGNPMGDRRGYIAISTGGLLSGEEKSWDLAFIMNRRGDHLDNVAGLLEYSDSVQLFYSTEIANDNGVHDLPGMMPVPESGDLLVYPNPATNVVTVSLGDMEGDQVQILSGIGQVIEQVAIEEGMNSIMIDLESHGQGIYFIRFGSRTKKVVLQ